jgi:hypothetical protein
MAAETENELKSIEQRDREWLEQVYRGGSARDFTPRAVLAGMAFGGVMSLSNLYVGLKSGWGLDVGVAAIIVIFAVFKGLQGLGLVRREFGLMESTITMTVAVAASWISSAGLISAVPALTMLTGYQFVWWHLTLLIGVILYLGVFVAIPLKRQMIQDDSLRFPSNIPVAETLKAMYSQGRQAMTKAKALGIAGVAGMLVAGLRDGLNWIPDQLESGLAIGGVSLTKLTLTLEPSLIFIGIGALFGMKVGLSMLLGVILNYGILAPRLINARVIHHAPPQVQALLAPTLPLPAAAGETLSVALAEANAGPELSSGINSRMLRYTWTGPAVYTNLAGLAHDLNAPALADGSPNPLYNAVRAGEIKSKELGPTCSCWKPPLQSIGRRRCPFRPTSPPELSRRSGSTRGPATCGRSGAFAISAPGPCGPGRRCWWSGDCLRWPFNGGRSGAPLAAFSPASGARKTALRAASMTLKFRCPGL